MEAARHYLRHPTLRNRLLTVTRLATEHLQKGVHPQTLFGRSHLYDGPKFLETSLVFATAAMMEGATEDVSIFVDGVNAFPICVACREPSLHHALHTLLSLSDKEIIDAVSKVRSLFPEKGGLHD